MGVSSGYALKKEAEFVVQIGLLALISLISIISGSGCLALIYWLKKLRLLMEDIERELFIKEFPLQGARVVGIVVALSVFLISLSAAIIMVLKING